MASISHEYPYYAQPDSKIIRQKNSDRLKYRNRTPPVVDGASLIPAAAKLMKEYRNHRFFVVFPAVSFVFTSSAKRPSAPLVAGETITGAFYSC